MKLTTDRKPWVDRALMAALLCSVALNFALIVKLRSAQSPTPARERVLEVGTKVPAIEARSHAGQAVRIETAGRRRPLALYVFAPECGWCVRNSENFKALTAHAAGRFDVAALSLTSEKLDEFVRAHGITAPVYHGPSERTVQAYRLGATPGLIVISEEGTVLKHWRGAWRSTTLRELEEYFEVKLPGVAMATAKRS